MAIIASAMQVLYQNGWMNWTGFGIEAFLDLSSSVL